MGGDKPSFLEIAPRSTRSSDLLNTLGSAAPCGPPLELPVIEGYNLPSVFRTVLDSRERRKEFHWPTSLYMQLRNTHVRKQSSSVRQSVCKQPKPKRGHTVISYRIVSYHIVGEAWMVLCEAVPRSRRRSGTRSYDQSAARRVMPYLSLIAHYHHHRVDFTISGDPRVWSTKASLHV